MNYKEESQQTDVSTFAIRTNHRTDQKNFKSASTFATRRKIIF